MKQKTTDEGAELEYRWGNDRRWRGINRDYSAQDVFKFRTSVKVEYTLAKRACQRMWTLLETQPFLSALGCLTGAQAVQMVKAGLKSIYVSGWQVAADHNLSSQTYPDLSLYPSNSVPNLVKRLNNALMRADQIDLLDGKAGVDWYVPILADAEAGFGGPLHAFELMKTLVEAGAAAVHFEDQLAAEKKCGHMGGKVLVPTAQFIRTLVAARLATDVLDVPTIIVARTDALGATLLTSDVDPRDRVFLTGERTVEGYYRVKNGIDITIARGLNFAPYADILWFETSKPDLDEAQEFAKAIRNKYPGKLMAYNCSPSFNWERNLDKKTIERFCDRLGEMGFKYQFITLAGWHLINLHTFELARAFEKEGMPAYVRLQNQEFKLEKEGYTATRHQKEVGASYFDEVLLTITGGETTTTALDGSTENEQFIPLAASPWNNDD